MERRLAGVLVLLVGLSCVLIVSGLLRHQVHPTAGRAPMPAPPAVGSCVDLVDADAGRTTAVVDCAAPHEGEVVVALDADDPHRAPQATSGRCTEAVPAYLGAALSHERGEWTVSAVSFGAVAVNAPLGQSIGDYGWSACVLTAHGTRYQVSLHDLTALDLLPAELGTCFDGPSPKSCADPHESQQLATAGAYLDAAQRAQASDERTAALIAALHPDCDALAAELAGTVDPTYSGALTVRVRIDYISQTLVPSFARGQVVAYRARCLLASADRQLVGSVLGLGDRPLPFA